MALPHYGVLIGTYKRFEKEPLSNFGQWFHGHVYLDVNGTEYQCAVDVNKPDGSFTYMMLGGLDPGMFTVISAKPDGYHELTPHAEQTGCMDYNRSPFIKQAKGCLAFIYSIFNAIFRTNEGVWKTNNGDDALNKLHALVENTSRVYVFGAPYSGGDHGMHDIHYNQGDPVNSQWHATDGIWQDGCVIVAKPGADKLSGYFGKFVSQSFNTDNNGWPA